MKAAKWRDLSGDEIEQKLRELGEEVFNLRFQLSMGVAKNPSRLREAKRDLARAKTIQREREHAPASGTRAGAHVGRATAPAKKG
ncbi:MAG: 50S ribosomal protein L29 [Candidatus Rokubacteria bacterium]|nr:50S ribosomal protein L29 [Candidatus Rokubacteria bacterium]